MVRLLHDGVCWLLSAVLLLTNGWPVAIQHAHDVGDDVYHHTHQTDHLVSGAGSFASIGEIGGAVSGVTEHVHMLWFGWEVTVVPPKGSKPSPLPSSAAVGMLAQVGQKDAAGMCQVATPGLAVAPAFAVEPCQRGDVSRPSYSMRRVAALPLCDSARHLRSGVQLI